MTLTDMRYGTNPLKAEGKLVEAPTPITVGVLNYIPEQIGYFKGQLDSLKLCLASIRCHTDQSFDLLVVDNGSCPEVRSYLQRELAFGRINYLILNERNIGEINGKLQVLQSAPGNLVFYTDGDVYFRPGWMQAHLEILKTFPNAGLVGGLPARELAAYYTGATLRWIEENKEGLLWERGSLIPEAWTRDFLESLGFVNNMEKMIARLRNYEDCRVTCNGVTAYVGASHMQFLTTRETIVQLPQQRLEQAMGRLYMVLDSVIDAAGLLRLSTARPFVYHIGNRITEAWLMDEFKRLVPDSPAQLNGPTAARRRHWFWRRPKVRQALRWLHEWAFDMDYRQA